MRIPGKNKLLNRIRRSGAAEGGPWSFSEARSIRRAPDGYVKMRMVAVWRKTGSGEIVGLVSRPRLRRVRSAAELDDPLDPGIAKASDD